MTTKSTLMRAVDAHARAAQAAERARLRGVTGQAIRILDESMDDRRHEVELQIDALLGGVQ